MRPASPDRHVPTVWSNFFSLNTHLFAMKLPSSSRLFSRVAAAKSSSMCASYSSLQPNGRRAFWRPSRWFQARSTAVLSSGKMPFLYRFQRKNLINHVDKRHIGSSWARYSLRSSAATWGGRKSLAKWTKTTLKWTPIPIFIGIVALVYRQFLARRAEEDEATIPDASSQILATYARRRLPWEVPKVFYVYQFLPLRALSRTWGWLNDLYLPHWLRRPVLSSYVWLFDCNLQEAAIPDLKWYKNLGEFFRRHLKPGVRPVEGSSCVVSPSDGVVLHVGRVEDDCVEQVKGMTYSLAAFLGPKNWFAYTKEDEPIIEEEDAPEPSADYRRSLSLRSRDTDLFHCVIYLAPGDYHRFHSPADWNIFFRRHFPGHLFSVSPSITKRIEGLFNYNERVVYYGTWQHGFFSMAAVGATNVGSIRVYFDERLKTNNRRYKRGVYQDWNFAQHKSASGPTKAVTLGKGDEFGEFNLGSTIVLLFEAPKNFQFNVEVGERVLYGRELGRLGEEEIPFVSPNLAA